jgi:hypothetical protein
MSLLSTCELPELRLWNPRNESLQAAENLSHSLRVQPIPHRLLDERLDLSQAGTDKVVTHAVVDLGQNGLEELGVALLEIKHLVDVPGGNQVIDADSLAQNEGLIGLADTEALHKPNRATTLGD